MGSNNIVRKTLYALTTDGITIQVACYHNTHTQSFGVCTSIKRSPGNRGRSKTNRECASFLGCHVAERILSKIFENVKLMPYRNPGYDFKCANEFLIDVKASTARIGKTDNACSNWMFHINKNPVADYFLCLAFDNRTNLKPLHLWLIPGKIINHLQNASISTSTLDKWSAYELPDKLDDVKLCCNILKGE